MPGYAAMRCRMIHEVGTRARLRIYWNHPTKCRGGEVHNAWAPLGGVDSLMDWHAFGAPGDHPDPAEWPAACADCGAPVPPGYFLNSRYHYPVVQPDGSVVYKAPEDEEWNHLQKDAQGRTIPGVAVPQYQVFRDRLYDTPTGRPAPGDMYWLDCHHKGECHYWDNCTGPHLWVVLPNGIEWDIDSRCRNCTLGNDRTHRCWVRTGEPPNVTAGKGGHTCSAGAGSIAAGDYHGFLRDGVLTAG